MTSSKGLVSIENQDKIKVFTRSTGLLNDQFNYNSGYADSSGILYFGSVKGMISVNPEQCFLNNFIPPLYITGFNIQQSGIATHNTKQPAISALTHKREIRLEYNQSSFAIDFAALSFVSPEMTSYRYMLTGVDETWNELTTNRRVYYTNVSPGKYTFRVEAGINSQWTGKETVLKIVIRPPWWRSLFAYIIYFLSAALLLFFLIRFLMERAREKREHELYTAKIDFFTAVAHEIRTPLTLIKGPVENINDKIEEYPQIREDVKTLSRNTERLIALASGVLDFRKTETKGFSLEFTRVDLTGIIEETILDYKPMAMQQGLQVNVELMDQKCIISADEDGIRKIISNLFSNAIKYAEKKVTVRMFVENTGVKITFRNDGYKIPVEMSEKVFEPFFRIRETSKQKGTGIGLALSRSLAELHKGRLYLQTGTYNDNLFVLSLPLTIPVKNTGRALNHKNES
jgi:signal transduction histidine kinase